MNTDGFHELQVLNEVEKSPVITNRMLSGKMGVSVKLAHYVLKKLASKGMLHMKRRDGRSWYYFLTPQGVAEKLRLTYQFLDFSKQFYGEARKRSSEVCLRLAREGVKRVAFLGTGELAEISFLGLAEQKLTLVDIFDEETAGETFLGRVVKPLANLPRSKAERILITLYDPTQPMKAHYLPQGVKDDQRLVWVFDHSEMVEEIVEGLRGAGSGEKQGGGGQP
jgi:DNA-binding MarR family transcriptional regulator